MKLDLNASVPLFLMMYMRVCELVCVCVEGHVWLNASVPLFLNMCVCVYVCELIVYVWRSM